MYYEFCLISQVGNILTISQVGNILTISPVDNILTNQNTLYCFPGKLNNLVDFFCLPSLCK